MQTLILNEMKLNKIKSREIFGVHLFENVALLNIGAKYCMNDSVQVTISPELFNSRVEIKISEENIKNSRNSMAIHHFLNPHFQNDHSYLLS